MSASQLPPEPSFEVMTGDQVTDKPFKDAVQSRGKLFDTKTGAERSVTLVPMGRAVLRKVRLRMSPDGPCSNDDRGDGSCR